jgi:hypothetical protein
LRGRSNTKTPLRWWRLTAERPKAGKVARPGVTRLERMAVAAHGRTDEVTHRALAPWPAGGVEALADALQ